MLAEEAKRTGAVLIHYSTDYVFDGTRDAPYDEDAPAGPLNVYGESKLEGERAIAACGAAALDAAHELGVRLARQEFPPDDQAARRASATSCASSPTRSARPTGRATLAEATATPGGAGAGRAGRARRLYHFTSAGSTTWHGFARAIVGDARERRWSRPITTAEYPTPARRPAYGVLATGKFGASSASVFPPGGKAGRLSGSRRNEPERNPLNLGRQCSRGAERQGSDPCPSHPAHRSA